MSVVVLFARTDSNYKKYPVDVYDIERDAKTYTGGSSVVAHPPCRAWGRLYKFAKPEPGEKELAFYAVDKVRECGGVLEHPAGSKLWKECGLPVPGDNADRWGGYSISVKQFWWGHKAAKSTWLYICGVDRSELPPAPLVFGEPTHVVSGGKGRKPELTKPEREHTPEKFCEYLIDIAGRCEVKSKRREIKNVFPS